MPLVAAISLFAVFFILWAVTKKWSYLLPCLLAASLTEYLIFTLMYIAKKGGIGDSIRFLLFLSDDLRRYLQYTRLTLQQLSFGLAIGRFLFPWLFLLTAVSYYSDSKRWGDLRRYLWLTVLPPAISLIIYYPPVFVRAVTMREMQEAVAFLSFGWIGAYLILGTVLLVREPRNLRIRYIRRAAVMRGLLLFSAGALYALYCPQDPAQVYLLYHDTALPLFGLWYLNPYLSQELYLLVLGANLVFTALGAFSMMTMARLEWSQNQDDIRLQYKYDAASLGSSVFVHGIKNQLLANRVLCRRLLEQLRRETPDRQAVEEEARQLAENNEELLRHVEELHKSFRSNVLSMRQYALSEVVGEARASLLRKYPEALVEVQIPEGMSVFADKAHLTAALGNLLINGWEATLKAGRQEPLTITCYEKRRHVGICVRDCGVGIGAFELERIFEPFYSSKNSTSNWGLGLYYVRNIVKKHMGSINVESEPDKGTRFFILLPKLLPKRRERRGKRT